MKAVYSYWSRPSPLNIDRAATLALSVNLAVRHFAKVEFVGDEESVRLVGRMHLPFTATLTTLESLTVTPMAWAAGKLAAQLVQTEPYLHIDGDVLLFRPLPAFILESAACAQSPEPWSWYQASAELFPPIVGTDFRGPAFNTGIVGGTDLEFLGRYAAASLDRISRYPTCFPRAMTLVEQALLGKIAGDSGVHVRTLFPAEAEAAAEELGYCHLMNAKKLEATNRRILARLEKEFPPTFGKLKDTYAF